MSGREKNLNNSKNIRKKIIVTIIFLLIMLCAILLTWKLVLINKTEKTSLDLNINENNIIEIENEIENTADNVAIQQNNTKVNAADITTSSEEKSVEEIEKEEDKKEKAITLTKNNWGEDSNVYFTYDSIDERGNYIVYIREKSTTHAIARSIVDIKTGTCTLE